MKKKQYRVKTEEEMIASFGNLWKSEYFSKCTNSRTYWASPSMDYLFGMILDIDDKYYCYNGSIRTCIDVANINGSYGGTWSLTINQLVEINIKPTYTKRKITS